METCASCGAPLAADGRFCPACGAAVERRPPPADERKVATMLFADLVGSTALADSEDPERTRVILDRFYDAMSEEIELAGGTVEKFVGDAVMAAFGAPAALEDHAERALHAALAMQRRLREMHGDRLALRIGVNTGDVVVGRPREGSSFVTGDAVNVTARLEQAAAPGEIVVGERTVVAVRGAFEFDDPVTLEAKGKPDGVRARKLIRALSLMRPRGAGGLRQAFVGRDRELQRLQEIYTGVIAGDRHLVVLLGDAGVGKSRLVRELWQWLAAQEPQPLQRTGRCLSYGHGVTYWPLAEILREHFALLDSDANDVVAARLGDHPGLALTLGLDGGEQIHPLVARERLQDSWVEFLQEQVLLRPVVVLIEDVHWADEELCDLLELIVARVDGPLLVVATARPEFLERRPALCGARRNTSSLPLETLPATDTRELLERLLGTEPPSAVQELVVARAEGNPFFVEELLATLIDRGLLARRNGGWTCADLPPGFTIPDTVQAVLAARIDLLPAAEKAALQAASVIGRIFWTGPVYELLGGSRPDFGLLEERDFCRRRTASTLPAEREYAIKHALTREVAYESVPKARRARLHAAFAHWLERTADASEDHAAMLAHHYGEAVRPEDLDLAWGSQAAEVDVLHTKAVHWSRRAAAAALARYEIDEALALLRRALAYEPDPRRQGELWYEIGRASALKYDGEGFTAAMATALELAGPSADVYAELAFQTVQRAGMWRRRPERSVVADWIDRALELSAPASLQHGKALVARALWEQPPGAVAAAFAAAERLGDAGLEAHAVAAAAGEALRGGDTARANELVRRLAALLPSISDPDQQGTAYLNRVEILSALGGFAELPALLAEYEAVMRGLTAHHRLHAAGARVSVLSFTGGWKELAALSPQLEHAVQANIDSPCPFNVVTLLLTAAGHEYTGDPAAATRLEAWADEIGMEGYEPMFDPARLRLELARNDLAATERLVRGLSLHENAERYGYLAYEMLTTYFDALVALDALERIEAEAPSWLAPGTSVEPFALRALAIARADEGLLGRAADRFAAIGLEWQAGETRRLLSGSS